MRRRTPFFIFFLCVSTAFIADPGEAQIFDSLDFSQSVFEFFASEFGDIRSAALFNQILGPLYPSANGGRAGATPFSLLIGLVNLIFLAIGGWLFAYNLTAGLLQSAHEGAFLGRRWSSLWAPLRVLFAVALLIPAPGLGGYNVIQGGVAWLTKGATLMASELWSKGSEIVLAGEIPLTGASPRLDNELFGAIYRNQLCLWLANHQFALADSPMRVQFSPQKTSPLTIMSSVDGRRESICGSYRLPATPAYISKLESSMAPAIESQFRAMHADILQNLIAKADAIVAKQWPFLISKQGELPAISEDIWNAFQTANQSLVVGSEALMSSVSAMVNESNQARQRIIEKISHTGCGVHSSSLSHPTACGGTGWIGAGNWHMTMARLNSELMGLLNARSQAEESHYLNDGFAQFNTQVVRSANPLGRLSQMFVGTDYNKFLHIDEAARIWQDATRQFDRAAIRLGATSRPVSGQFFHDEQPVVGRTGWLGKIWQIGFADAIGSMVTVLSPGQWADDPIVGVVRMGNWYLDVAGALIFGGAATSILSGGFGTAVIFMVAAPLTAIGVTQSFILPALPFIFWILAVASYFLLVIEAVVAASLWAVAHMRLDGEGISGEAGRYGWLMLLALTMTPSLMILGYLAAMVLFRVTAQLFDAGMFYAMSALAHASPLVAIFGIMASGFIIIFAYTVLMERSFSLISSFPGRVLRWIGGDIQLSDSVSEGRFQSGLRGAGSAFGSGATAAGRLSVQGTRAMRAGQLKQ